jgi:hypothetical protein
LDLENLNNMKISNRGQGLLEFALVLPFLLVVLFGVFDLGRLYFSSITITSAAREGARYLSVYPEDVSNSYDDTELVAIQEAENSGILLDDDDVVVFCLNEDSDYSHCDSGYPAIVTITHDFDLILGWLLSSPIPITRSAQMVVP